MNKYPDVYILGRQVNGVYVEYKPSGIRELKNAQDKAECLNQELARLAIPNFSIEKGEWKVLKYGTPKTVEVDDESD